MSAAALPECLPLSALLPFLDEVASLGRFEDRHTNRHRERQDEDDDRQLRALIRILTTPRKGCRACGEDEQEHQRQGCTWRGKDVEHWSHLPRQAQTGCHGKLSHRAEFPVRQMTKGRCA